MVQGDIKVEWAAAGKFFYWAFFCFAGFVFCWSVLALIFSLIASSRELAQESGGCYWTNALVWFLKCPDTVFMGGVVEFIANSTLFILQFGMGALISFYSIEPVYLIYALVFLIVAGLILIFPVWSIKLFVKWKKKNA